MSRSASSSVTCNLQQTFQHKLQKDWKRRTACGRFYVDTNSLVAWMNESETDNNLSNAGRLLIEVYPRNSPRGRTLVSPSTKDISSVEDRALLVFGILLELGHGDLIDLFQRSKIIDKDLSTSQVYRNQLQYELASNGVPDPIGIIDKFERAKWSFCPAIIRNGKSERFINGTILPYSKRDRVNEKGGTAEVWQVLLQEDVMKQDLKEAIKGSRFKHKEFGWCYQMALKTYAAGSAEIYNWELNAYKLLRNQTGMVQYLGDYLVEEPDGPASKTHNILLEYGEHDLDEFFANTSPPVRALEIVRFYRSMFEVAKALSRLHNLEYKHEDGFTDDFNGWHADVKPDNILRVHGEFKLADFGFAKFQQKNKGAPMAYIEGGTGTFGAPETARQRVRRTATPVTQSIDTWSYGCVLSITVTWVALGFQGILQYEALRIRAIQGLREAKKKDERQKTPTADDAFHDGSDVLPEIEEWHNYLRSVMRTSDPVSARVLDLVEEKMLRKDPRRRLSSQPLCEELDTILKKAEIEQSKAISPGETNDATKTVLEALLDFDNRVRNNPSDASVVNSTRSTSKKTQSTSHTERFDDNNFQLNVPRHHSSRKSKRIGKSQRLDNVTLRKTAHRANLLMQELEEENRIHTISEDGSQPSTSHAAGTESPRVCESPTDHGLQQQGEISVSPEVKPAAAPELLTEEDPVTTPEMLPETPTALTPPVRSAVGSAPFSVDSPSFNLSNNKSYATNDTNAFQAPSMFGKRWASSTGNESVEASAIFAPSEHDADQDRELAISSSRGKDMDASRKAPATHTQPFSNVYQLPLPREPLDIYRVDRDMREKRSTGLSLRSVLGKPKKDAILKNFITNRDLVFVVDNGSTMYPYWLQATFVLEVLATKVAGLDDDGLDLFFTIGEDNNISGANGKNTPSRFRKAMENAAPPIPGTAHQESKTNMSETLSRFFSKFSNSSVKKATTLLVLTDGVWKGSVEEKGVEKRIIEFFKRLSSLDYRPFTISFIRFGDDENAMHRLRKLDDDLAPEFGIQDVIDHVSWKGRVQKMILGSMREDEDEDGGENDIFNAPISPEGAGPRLLSPNRPATSRTLQDDVLTPNGSARSPSPSNWPHDPYEPPHRVATTQSGKKQGRFSGFFG